MVDFLLKPASCLIWALATSFIFIFVREAVYAISFKELLRRRLHQHRTGFVYNHLPMSKFLRGGVWGVTLWAFRGLWAAACFGKTTGWGMLIFFRSGVDLISFISSSTMSSPSFEVIHFEKRSWIRKKIHQFDSWQFCTEHFDECQGSRAPTSSQNPFELLFNDYGSAAAEIRLQSSLVSWKN